MRTTCTIQSVLAAYVSPESLHDCWTCDKCSLTATLRKTERRIDHQKEVIELLKKQKTSFVPGNHLKGHNHKQKTPMKEGVGMNGMVNSTGARGAGGAAAGTGGGKGKNRKRKSHKQHANGVASGPHVSPSAGSPAVKSPTSNSSTSVDSEASGAVHVDGEKENGKEIARNLAYEKELRWQLGVLVQLEKDREVLERAIRCDVEMKLVSFKMV
ncbi:hypothetical protein HK102_002434 [Quaeritorhiza haematococci]|nr:hypothetical protein HK102_002434 [Quaeritorhiza haematococci]